MLIFFPYISYEKFSEKVSKQLFFGLLECLLLVFFYLFFLVYQKFLSTSSKILHKFLDRFNATSSRKPAMLLIYCRYHLYMHLLYFSLKYNTGQNNWIESKESINADQGVGKQLLLIFFYIYHQSFIFRMVDIKCYMKKIHFAWGKWNQYWNFV